VKVAAKLALGDFGILEPEAKPAPPTFAQVAGEWERIVAPSRKKGTQIEYTSILRSRLLPVFGPLRINEVTSARVEAWWTALREEGLSKKRLGNVRAVLDHICRRAVRQGLLPTNPVEWIQGSLGRVDREIREADYLVPEDLNKLLEVAERTSPPEYPIFLVMATAGLRIGEAVGLQVGDLDATGRQLHVRRSVRRAFIGSPKNGRGRVVDLPASTVTVLERLRQTRQAEAAYQGGEARWFFPGEAPNMPVTPEHVQRALQKVLRAAGLRRIHPHVLRHSYATLAIQAGVPLLTVSRQLGHQTIAVTADIYTHAVPGSNRAAAEALEAILTRNQTQPPRNLPA
jgi:integrase